LRAFGRYLPDGSVDPHDFPVSDSAKLRVMLSEGSKRLTKAVRQELTENDRRLRRALIAFFARRVQTLSEAEDLTQDVFFRIVRDPKREAPMADAYVFRIAANLLRDKGRRERVRTSYRESRAIEDFLGIDPLDPHRVAEGRENLGLVARTIDQLPEKTRRIFTLYRIEHIDKRTIADSFGLSVRMVEIHVQRALEALASSMEKSR
jgi:RNA polymerase sigma-70 factor (ECF subfamily)